VSIKGDARATHPHHKQTSASLPHATFLVCVKLPSPCEHKGRRACHSPTQQADVHATHPHHKQTSASLPHATFLVCVTLPSPREHTGRRVCHSSTPQADVHATHQHRCCVQARCLCCLLLARNQPQVRVYCWHATERGRPHSPPNFHFLLHIPYRKTACRCIQARKHHVVNLREPPRPPRKILPAVRTQDATTMMWQ